MSTKRDRIGKPKDDKLYEENNEDSSSITAKRQKKTSKRVGEETTEIPLSKPLEGLFDRLSRNFTRVCKNSFVETLKEYIDLSFKKFVNTEHVPATRYLAKLIKPDDIYKKQLVTFQYRDSAHDAHNGYRYNNHVLYWFLSTKSEEELNIFYPHTNIDNPVDFFFYFRSRTR